MLCIEAMLLYERSNSHNDNAATLVRDAAGILDRKLLERSSFSKSSLTKNESMKL